MLVSAALALAFRVLFNRSALSPKTFAFWIYALSFIPSIFLSRYLERIGSPRNDPTTGTLISSGEDLARPGILEWCFDVVYITCKQYLSSIRPQSAHLPVKGPARSVAGSSEPGFGGYI